MRSSKQKQESTNTSTNTGTSTSSVGETQDIQNLRDFKAKIDPGIAYQFSRLRKGVEQGFNDPLGGHYAPQVRDAITRSSQASLGQQEAEANRQGEWQADAMNMGKLSDLANLTAPRTTTGSSTGTSTGTGTVTNTPSWIQTGSQIAGGIASGFA